MLDATIFTSGHNPVFYRVKLECDTPKPMRSCCLFWKKLNKTQCPYMTCIKWQFRISQVTRGKRLVRQG